MAEIQVNGEDVERALKTLKRKLIRECLFRELKERRFHSKPSEKKKKKAKEAQKRKKKENKRGFSAGH